MSDFSPTDAAFEGFRLTREKPVAVLIWSTIFAATILIASMLIVMGLAPRLAGAASNLDTDNPAYGGMMMLHAVGTGNAARDYSAIEVGMMQDLGYTAVTAVPEPESLAMMFAGLGVIGSLQRRRRTRTTTA